MDKAFGKAYIFFIAINCLATFLLFGMPKVYTNKHHFTDQPIRPHYTDFYSPVKEMTVTAEDGSAVTLTPNDQIATYEIDKINKEIEKALHGSSSEQKESESSKSAEDETVRLHILDKSVTFELTLKELHDTGKFKNITEQVKLAYEASDALKKAEGEKEYNEYMANQKIWFLLPHKYIGHYVVGLSAAAFAFLVNFLIGRKHPAIAVILSLVMIALKTMGIIYWYLHPMVCH